jgi:hypothetical protein
MYPYSVTFIVDVSNGDVWMQGEALKAGSRVHNGTDYSNKAASCEQQGQYFLHSPISSL